MKSRLHFFKAGIILAAFLFSFIMAHSQTYNFITTGDMESQGWTGIPGNTNLACSFDSGSGINGTTSLKQ